MSYWEAECTQTVEQSYDGSDPSIPSSPHSPDHSDSSVLLLFELINAPQQTSFSDSVCPSTPIKRRLINPCLNIFLYLAKSHYLIIAAPDTLFSLIFSFIPSTDILSSPLSHSHNFHRASSSYPLHLSERINRLSFE